MFNDKKLNDVAKAVAQVMENQVKEELKGNQHKIDANKNNKVDSHDFKLLRAGKKVAKEGVEQKELNLGDEHKLTVTSHKFHISYPKYSHSHGEHGRQHEVFQTTDLAAGHKHADSMSKGKHKVEDISKSKVKRGGGFDSKEPISREGWFTRKGEKVNEEVEQVEEGIEDKLEAARAKAKAAGKILKGPAKPAKSNVTKVAGKAYGGSAQKDEPEDDEDDTPKKATKKGVFKRRYNTRAGREAKDGIYKEQFSYLLDSYVNGGLKGIMENLEIVEVEEDQFTEEASNDEYKTELSDAQAKSEGKKKANVAAASVQAVTKEEVEQVDEGKMHKMSLSGLWHKHAEHSYLADQGYGHGTVSMHHNATAATAIENHVRKHHGNKVADDMVSHSDHHVAEAEYAGPDEGEQHEKEMTKLKAKHGINEGVEQVDERTLTSSEMETREKNVKGMKKNLAGFKERYGDRAKDVMYATATRMAKKGE